MPLISRTGSRLSATVRQYTITGDNKQTDSFLCGPKGIVRMRSAVFQYVLDILSPPTVMRRNREAFSREDEIDELKRIVGRSTAGTGRLSAERIRGKFWSEEGFVRKAELFVEDLLRPVQSLQG